VNGTGEAYALQLGQGVFERGICMDERELFPRVLRTCIPVVVVVVDTDPVDTGPRVAVVEGFDSNRPSCLDSRRCDILNRNSLWVLDEVDRSRMIGSAYAVVGVGNCVDVLVMGAEDNGVVPLPPTAEFRRIVSSGKLHFDDGRGWENQADGGGNIRLCRMLHIVTVDGRIRRIVGEDDTGHTRRGSIPVEQKSKDDGYVLRFRWKDERCAWKYRWKDVHCA
jgi:hypothetical protein